MPEKEYQISDTECTAEWEKAKWGEGVYFCTNCKNTKNPGYPAQSYSLDRFCGRCGFKMRNPMHVKIEIEFEDFY